MRKTLFILGIVLVLVCSGAVFASKSNNSLTKQNYLENPVDILATSLSISGAVLEGSSALSGVIMNGTPGNVTTDVSGYYYGIVSYGWSGFLNIFCFRLRIGVGIWSWGCSHEWSCGKYFNQSFRLLLRNDYFRVVKHRCSSSCRIQHDSIVLNKIRGSRMIMR